MLPASADLGVKRILLVLLGAYRRFVSPLLPDACRLVPSCSEYAAAAIAKHGAMRGGILAAKRLARCNPWHPGGFDPVPDAARAAHEW